jgi:hypothetical protein
MTLVKRLIYILLMDKTLGDGLTAEQLLAYLNKVSDPKITLEKMSNELGSLLIHKNVFLDDKKYKLTVAGRVVYNVIINNDVGRFLMKKVSALHQAQEAASEDKASESIIDNDGKTNARTTE